VRTQSRTMNTMSGQPLLALTSNASVWVCRPEMKQWLKKFSQNGLA
jgi:hypothetical protein